MTTTAERIGPLDTEGARRHASGDRFWFGVLVAVVVATVPILLWYGRHQWFFLDEWSFLVNRSLSHPHTLFEPHNGHWVTVPAVVYRVLFAIWGITTYRPYQLASIVVHGVVVLLVWAVMRRLGVRAWIATATSASLILFGSGVSNIIFGFQITLTGAVACGFAQLLLADHDGALDRRDAAALVFGLGGLMFSGVGVAMVVVVAVAMLLRRGWRVAMFHSLPLAVAYGAWYLAFPSDTGRDYTLSFDTVRFVATMIWSVFDDLGQYAAVGVVLAAVACVGIGWSLVLARRARSLRPLALPAGLVAGVLAFASTTAIARVNFGTVRSASSDRYVDVATALLLPIIALGVELIARRQLVMAAAPLVLLAVGVPGNVDALGQLSVLTRGSRVFVETAAYSPLLRQLPADTRLQRIADFAPDLAPTAGWLRKARADGRVRRPSHVSAQAVATTDLLLAVQSERAPISYNCPAAESARRVRVSRGDRISFSGTLWVSAIRGGVQSFVIAFDAPSGGVLKVLAGPLDLVIAGASGRAPRLC